MSMIKVITSDAQDLHGPVAQLIKLSSRGLVGEDRSVMEKRASTDILRQLAMIKRATDEPLIHLLAIGATEDYGANRNGDGFTRSCCQTYHPTFVKHAHFYRDHKNKDPKKCYGHVKLSAWNPDMKRIELVVALNGSQAAADRNGGLLADKELEKLASNKDIAVSMACRVPFDVCSWCGNKAASRDNYCTGTDEGGLCKAGGLKDNIGQIVEMIKEGKPTLHHLHADNPNPTFFDISHVFRPADRIAYVLGELQKAAGHRKVSGAELAETMGITVPYELLVDQQHPGDVQRMLKLAYQLADMEGELERQGGPTDNYVHAFSPEVQALDRNQPALLQEKFGMAMRALADVRACLPLAGFVEIVAGQPAEKAAAVAEIVQRELPGVYSRLLTRSDFTDRVASNPFVAAATASAPFRAWATKQASALGMSQSHLDSRLTLAAIRKADTLTVRRGVAHEKIASVRGPVEQMAEQYALYKLAFLAAQSEADPEFPLTASMVILQNYAG